MVKIKAVLFRPTRVHTLCQLPALILDYILLYVYTDDDIQ